jgi:hypothetical protein
MDPLNSAAMISIVANLAQRNALIHCLDRND